MRAKITHPEGFKIFQQGKTEHFPEGTVVAGVVAEKAVAARRASAMLEGKKAPKNKATKPPENKSEL